MVLQAQIQKAEESLQSAAGLYRRVQLHLVHMRTERTAAGQGGKLFWRKGQELAEKAGLPVHVSGRGSLVFAYVESGLVWIISACGKL